MTIHCGKMEVGVGEMSVFAVILGLHIAAGSVALGQCGATVCQSEGWACASCTGLLPLATAALKAWALSALRLLDAVQSNDERAWFLGYVGVLSAASVWMGLRSLKLKRDKAPNYRPYGLFRPFTLLGSALMLGVQGITNVQSLQIVFSALGLGMAIPQLKYWLQPRQGSKDWLKMHLSAMGTGAISAVTAFFVVNVDNWGLQEYYLWFWIAPGVVGGTALSLASRRYGQESNA